MALFSTKTEKKHDAAKIASAPKATKAVKKTTADKKAAKSKPMEAAITSPAVKVVKATKVTKAEVAIAPVTKIVSVIIAPHMTEKAGIQHEALNVYTFKVLGTATKGSITKAIKSEYKVTPVKVNIVNIPDRPITYRGRPSTASGFKKAMVFLKKGDKIEFAA
ncbi:MAG: 50S ribosomal protein L23 [bacterium]